MEKLLQETRHLRLLLPEESEHYYIHLLQDETYILKLKEIVEETFAKKVFSVKKHCKYIHCEVPQVRKYDIAFLVLGSAIYFRAYTNTLGVFAKISPGEMIYLTQVFHSQTS